MTGCTDVGNNSSDAVLGHLGPTGPQRRPGGGLQVSNEESPTSAEDRVREWAVSDNRNERCAVPSLEVRIAERITSDGSAIISPRIARWIEDTCKLTADRRIRLRDTDPDAYVTLTALHLAALRSDSGTNQAAGQRNTTQSKMWLSTKQAAEELNVSDRCVRKWCATGRLHAERVGARWLINPNSIALKDIA